MEIEYWDMDGVIADFDRGCVEILKSPYKDLDAGWFWNTAVLSYGFYRKLKPIDEGMERMRASIERGTHVMILSSTGGGQHHNEIAIQKTNWLHSQGIRVPMCFAMGTKTKSMWAGPGRHLIDDNEGAVKAFIEAGGTAELFER